MGWLFLFKGGLQINSLKKIARKTVIQGNHKNRIVEYYRTLISAAREEFREDNKPTLDAFLKDCHNDALRDDEWRKQREQERKGK